jgi:hypothetical protein
MGRSRLYSYLVHPQVVGDEQAHRVELEGHQQRHQLVGAWFDVAAGKGAKRPGAGAKAEAYRVAQHPAGAEVAHVLRVRRVEAGRLYVFLLQGQVDAGDFLVGTAERP